MTALPGVVDEKALSVFRENYLSARTLYEVIPDDGAALLVSAPPGTGKTHAAHSLIPYALHHDHDLVVFVAPTRALIAELMNSGKLDALLAQVVVLERRPRARCGDLDAAWVELEQSGCAALGKSDLCGCCPRRECDDDECGWVEQMDRIGVSTQVVILTEQYLVLHPLLLQDLRCRAKSRRPLVIFDEAAFLATINTRRFSTDDLAAFCEALEAVAKANGGRHDGLEAWISGIYELLDLGSEDFDYPRFSLFDLGSSAVPIQAAGRSGCGSRFRYLAHDLVLLNSRVTTARWHRDGQFEIAVRIDTSGFDAVVFAPYLAAEIVEERFQRGVVRAIPNLVFRHSATRIANIVDPVGTLRTLSSADHFNRVVDFFTALLLRDRLLGRRSVVVAKKALVPRIKDRIETVTRALGRPLRCVVGVPGGSNDHSGDQPVVVLNYGIVGINSLQHHDTLYCVGGYYARQDHVSTVYQQSLSPDRRHHLRVETRDGRRRVVSGDGRFDTRYHAHRASATHRLLERTVALQAVGRVRPFTTAAEVILFQMDDLSGELGEIETHRTLGDARKAWEVPTLGEMMRSSLGDRMRGMRLEGASYREIATGFHVSVSTAHKALNSPSLDDLIGGINR